jgi:hypothetical protein
VVFTQNLYLFEHGIFKSILTMFMLVNKGITRLVSAKWSVETSPRLSVSDKRELFGKEWSCIAGGDFSCVWSKPSDVTYLASNRDVSSVSGMM